jgi:hypothetical protein
MSSTIHPPNRQAMKSHGNDGDSTSSEPDTKRRKIRKGTTSCWDCKKRKVKCTFDATSDTVCIACRRRGAPCVGQDQPEEIAQFHTDGNRDPLLARLQRVESLLEQLLEVGHKVERDVTLAGLGVPVHSKPGYFTPASDDQSHNTHVHDTQMHDTQTHDSFHPSPKPCIQKTGDVKFVMPEECRKLTEELLKAFPSQEDINAFCKSDYIATFYCHQIFTNAGDRPEHEAFEFVNNLAKIPGPYTPPVLVAKRMMILALFLQYFRSQDWQGLPEHPSIVMNRLVDTAVRLVLANDLVNCCIEGLECIILEGVFQANGGNLRRAWLAFRKAITVAQLMKIDHPNPPPVTTFEGSVKTNPKFMWFRIIYMDSSISLMLGLPHGGQDTNMEHDIPGETPNCKLERAHTLVGRRIIDRNRRDSFLQDLDTTRELDRELLRAAKALPDKFWSVPNFSSLQPNTRAAFWEVMRLCDQMEHYNLVHLLHLPYLLCGDKESSYHTYSKITCVNASRELLSRFLLFRKFNGNVATIYCRLSDFRALMAAMTIILAHIDSHKLEVDDWRAHQRLGDRAMVEQFLENLDTIGKRTNDSLTCKSAEQLKKLLEIESEAACGMDYSAHTTLCCLEEHCGELQLSIPYFGIIKIGREGITKDSSIGPSRLQTLPTDIPDSVHVANHIFSTTGFGEALHEHAQPDYFLPVTDSHSVGGSQLQMPLAISDDPESDFQQRQLQYPALAASVNDWPYQGVDAAFFDSVMRGTVDWDPTLQGNV